MNAYRRPGRAIAIVVAALGLAALVTVAAPRESAAQVPVTPPVTGGPGFDMRLFRPAVDSKGQFTVNGTDILGAGDLSFGFIADAGFGLFHAGVNNAPLVDVLFSGTLQVNLGIANLLVVGVSAPIILEGGAGSAAPALQGRMINNYMPSMNGLSFQGIGDIQGHIKLRILRSEYYPVGLSLILQGGASPMNAAHFLVGEPLGFLWPMVALEWRPSRVVRADFNLGSRIPFAISGSQLGVTGGPQTTYGVSLTWGAGVSWRAISVLDLVAETYGMLYFTGLADIPTSMPWEIVAGLKVFVQRNSYLMLGAGTHIPGLSSFAGADVRAFIGVIFEPSIGDTDGDGYRDDVDQCVNDPEDFDGFQDEDGCSDPDNDRDGIPDVDDRCPNVPEDRDGDHDEDGCPEGQEADRDGDGILDDVDQCPDEPEDRDGFQDTDGCPDPDNDQDTIPDTIDNCPNEPEDFDGFQDDDGCPDPDNDQDRIPDAVDHCPNDPETYNGVDDEDGCPDSGDLQILGNVINLRQQIQFETDSAEIRPNAINTGILEQMTNLIRTHPQFTQVEVEGHTDERAPDDHNLRLSTDRANAVMQALVQRGVEPARLVAAGYGEYCPLDPGHNARAWERNRRVQFIIVRTRDEGRTTAAAGCRRGAQYIPASVGPPGTGVARENSTSGTTPPPVTPNATAPASSAPVAPAHPAPAPAPAAH